MTFDVTAKAPVRPVLAVFDCDGTLVDSQWTIIDCMTSAFTVARLPSPTAHAVRRVVGLPLDEAIARLAPTASADVVATAADGYVAAFRASRQSDDPSLGVQEPLYPGSLDALDTLEAAGWMLGVATGKSHRGLIETLDQHGLTRRFVTVQTADRARGKPHPEMLLNAMAETGAAARDTVMIGDTAFDMEMARNAGTSAIGVAWGYHEIHELEESGAMAVVNHYGDLPRVIADIMEIQR